jgi:RNA polymerase sigma factor (sigma-70 family)
MREYSEISESAGEWSGHGPGSGTVAAAMYRSLEAGDLVRLAQTGNEGAWVALVDRYTPMLWSIARGHRLSAADAADVTQIAWLRLLQHLPSLRQPQLVAGWLATTARREALAVIRRTKREEPRDVAGDRFPTLEDTGDDADEGILRRERDRIVRQAMLKLPPRQQTLLRLLSADPPPNYRDISEATGIPVGSIGPTRARALRRLRTLLEQQGLRAG